MGTGVPSPELKRIVREVTHLRLVPRLRMSGAIALVPLTCLRGLDREKCTLLLIVLHTSLKIVFSFIVDRTASVV
jgi:hypothetical protein